MGIATMPSSWLEISVFSLAPLFDPNNGSCHYCGNLNIKTTTSWFRVLCHWTKTVWEGGHNVKNHFVENNIENRTKWEKFQKFDFRRSDFLTMCDSRLFHTNFYPIDKKGSDECKLFAWLRLHFFIKKTLKCSKNWRHFKFSFVLKTDYLIIEQTTWLVFHADRKKKRFMICMCLLWNWFY